MNAFRIAQIKKENEISDMERSFSLAPKILRKQKDLDRISPYLRALKKAVESKENFNIALTGPYGSGKSTILKTFQDLNNSYTFLNISLASFKEEESYAHVEEDEVGDETVEDERTLNKDEAKVEEKPRRRKLERLIELSILQQIFYQVKPTEIPDSQVKRIRSFNIYRLNYISLGFILWTVASLIFFKFDYIDKMNPRTWNFSFQDLDFIAIVLFLVIVSGVLLSFPNIIRLLSKSRLSKVSFRGEFELGGNIERSVLNEHLDEILYFFEKTDFDVIIIEDLDRFENTEVFTKLREVNLILNKSRLINRPIYFIYAVRDDMFQDKERTKFFDLIIPVIPYINPTNANDELNNIITNANLAGVFTSEFIDDVVTFIDDIDMRLLLNIFHEYVIYHEGIGEGLNQDNLLAMIIYKNLDPKDFVNLPHRSGKLYEFISNKKIYIQEITKDLEENIKILKVQVENIEKEKILEIQELKYIYITAIQQNIPDLKVIKLDGTEISTLELFEEDNFSRLESLKQIHYIAYQHQYNNQYSSKPGSILKSFKDIENSINPRNGFLERKKLITDKTNGKVEELKKEITHL